MDTDSNYEYAAVFQWPQVVSEPSYCAKDASYSCKYKSGPYSGDLDLCNFESGDSSGVFDADTGAFTFTTSDEATFPMGEYVFETLLMVGEETIIEEFSMFLHNCDIPTLTVERQPESGLEYTLRESALQIFEYDITTVVSSSLDENCGSPMIVFMTKDEMPLHEGYSDDRATEGAYKLSLESEDPELTGLNELKYRFWYKFMPSVTAESTIFTVNVINTCTPPKDRPEFEVPTLKAP